MCGALSLSMSCPQSWIGLSGRPWLEGNIPASLRTLRQVFHGQDRSLASTKSVPLAGLLAHSAEAAGSQLISARRTVRVSGRWSGSGLGGRPCGLGTDGSLGKSIGYVQKAWVSLWAQDRPKKGQLWALGCKWPRMQPFGQERGGRVVMGTQGIEKGMEKDSNPVVQSDRVSGITNDSSAKTIGQSEPAGHTHGPDSPYGRLGQTVGTSEWVRIAKGHELPRGTCVQRVLVSKGWSDRLHGNPVWAWALLGGIDPGSGLDQAPYALCMVWTHMMAMEGRLWQYLLSRRWLIKSSDRIMFHDDGSIAEH
ncbi:hypothetical protein IGI04_015328 [Brassica rapa subsp. trilocularis]|uniref:Uncharacterized protein n=1 Tax=Brassica rapa subsp. trilocularis TaxID=1813537 RepID=A0ABQ7MS99_BRACM|nr:hypothetical protein IGI04_015328 [Brassica rapa subsp. trilocularis]